VAKSYKYGNQLRVPEVSSDQLWGPPRLLSNGYRLYIPMGKERPGRDADHSRPSSAEVKNV
jgi:hypothetical protein